MSITEIQNIQNFQEFSAKINDKANSKFVVMIFTASWCGPCRMAARKYLKLANDFSDQCDIYKVDVDEHAQIAQKYSVRAMPTYIVFKGRLENCNRIP